MLRHKVHRTAAKAHNGKHCHGSEGSYLHIFDGSTLIPVSVFDIF
jgi:hypothetical protein